MAYISPKVEKSPRCSGNCQMPKWVESGERENDLKRDCRRKFCGLSGILALVPEVMESHVSIAKILCLQGTEIQIKAA